MKSPRELLEYWGKEVIVSLISGEQIQGVITGFDDSWDTSSGKDEVEIDVGYAYYGIVFEDIQTIKVVNEPPPKV